MHYGDFVPGQIVRIFFNTVQSDTTPITLAGTPAVSIYKDGSTTESTTGVTLTVDFDSRTGMHLVAIDTSSDATFYSANSDFRAVLTAGTVNSISAVGKQIGSFSIGNRASSVVQYKGTATAGTSTTVTLPASASATDNYYRGSLFAIVGGTGQSQSPRVCTAYVGSTKVATFGRAWATTPDNTSVIAILADQSPVLSSALGVTLDLTQAVPTSNTAQTVGDALNAARAQAFGPWTLDVGAKTLTMYANDGVTSVKVFNLDSATAPTERT